MYKDDYHSCRRTFATLRIYHKEAHPSRVTKVLRITPTNSQLVGDAWIRKGKRRKHPISGWFLESEGKVRSYDSAKHVAWILEKIGGKASALRKLRKEGWWMDISCYWDSEIGHGGPTL